MEANEERLNIFGTHISCLNLEEGLQKILNYNCHEATYVCFPSTGRISYAYNDSTLRTIYNNSLITFADGKFTEFYARLKRNKRVKNVSGYWLMDKLLQTDLTHFFYGCDDNTLSKLKKNLLYRYPTANIVGFKAPPYLELHEINNNKQIVQDFKEINELNPDLIWVGITSPKQDYLMYHFIKYLDTGIMLGVGAVFLYHAGLINKGPEIIKKLGMRWVWRLIQDPKSYFTRSFQGITYFFFLIIKHDLLKIKIK